MAVESLRFSEDGAVFPADLVDAIIEGGVVFLCGAGISRPQLPDFEQLVQRCFDHIYWMREAMLGGGAALLSYRPLRRFGTRLILGRRSLDNDLGTIGGDLHDLP